VLDRAGIVRFRDADPDWTKRTEPSTILDALRAARG